MRVMTAIVGCAMVGLVAAGCAAPVASPNGTGVPNNFAPYDEDTNPYCGALGTCQPLYNKPYPMRGNIG
ncbi:MAG TPA: hypothetical protein VMU42_08755 [Candidatus Sulfotelmatobacter sp.]|nr:hypothetical protein [Candidatus Sulfotelmatobacter sp.]